jgi:hypothetical protein
MRKFGLLTGMGEKKETWLIDLETGEILAQSQDRIQSLLATFHENNYILQVL